jgi:acyl-CoA dehydrogenase
MINLELPRKIRGLTQQAHTVAEQVFRPISRQYDLAEHSYPKELDMLAAVIDGMDAAVDHGSGAAGVRRVEPGAGEGGVRNGTNMSTVASIMELCWGRRRPAALDAAAGSGQLGDRLGRRRGAARAVRPPVGLDGDHRAGVRLRLGRDPHDGPARRRPLRAQRREDLRDGGRAVPGRRRLGDAGPQPGSCRDQVVPGGEGHAGFTVERLEDKLGIRASDTAALRLVDVRVPRENLLGSPEVHPERGFGGVMQTFDNTRPLVAGMAVGVARAALERTLELLGEAGIEVDYDRPALGQHAAAAAYIAAEADYEAAYLLTLRAAWLADNGTPNSLEASMAKAKAGRAATEIALRCVALAGSVGYGEGELLEKWARDAKILDIFEGTQQIQQLIVARRLLGKTSQELR